jgi:hypothetical protein
MKRLSIVLLSALVLTIAGTARAAAPPAAPDRAAAVAELDRLLAAHWSAQGITGNAPIADDVFVRRIYLDLAGRIPTSAEAVAFLDSSDPNKRAALIDDLLRRESYVANFFNLWADVLRFKSHYVNRANVIEPAYERFIKDSLRANKPYDRFVREMLSAKGYAWQDGAIGYYHRDPDMPLDNMAITTRVFLGTRVECAQCHDHPFDKWKQTQFYHLAAYTHANASLNEAFDAQSAAMRAKVKAVEDAFHQERTGSTDDGKAAAERKAARLAALDNRGVAGIVKGPVGQLFSPIGLTRSPTRGELKLPHDFRGKGGEAGDVSDPRPLWGAAPPVSVGQDRAAVFAAWVTSPDNPRFTRVIVNRLWKRMFGAGLTETFDDLKDDTTAMAPEAEAYAGRLMVALGYDVRAFLAVLANTRAYQSAASAREFERGRTYAFPGPLLRRMTAEQAWDSLVALGSYDPDAPDLARAARDERRINVSRMALDAYVNFDGSKLLDMALERLAADRALKARELAVREATVVAKRAGDAAKARELAHEQGRLSAERGQMMVNDFIMPMLAKLATRVGGPAAAPTIDPLYKVNSNPNALASETWRRTYVPGYGPAPKTAEQLAAEAAAEERRVLELAARLGVAEAERPAFVKYCAAARTDWVRASEMESPAPRGHFLRTMGQSDRDFVENANPTPAIPQALAMMNGELTSERGLLSPYSPLMRSVARAATANGRVDAVYVALLSRRPTAGERATWARAAARGMVEADLAYAILNTKEFLFVR